MEIPDEIPIDDETVDAVCGEMADDMVDEMAEFLSLQGNDRLWLRAAMPLIQLATKVDGLTTHERVRHAINDMAIAACERSARILRSDLPPLDLGFDDPADLA